MFTAYFSAVLLVMGLNVFDHAYMA